MSRWKTTVNGSTNSALSTSTSKWTSLSILIITILIIILTVNPSFVYLQGDGHTTQHLPDCSNRNLVTGLINQSKLLLVSTLDGRLTALDLNAQGSIRWTFATTTDDKGLFSSTVSNFQVINKGIPLRIIPSLDGSIYKLNERSGEVEPLPLNADTLLQSTYRLGDDLMISGGKETKSFGLNVLTGELQYVCGFKGCNGSSNENDTNEILVVRRDKYVVRGVEPKTGIERWNFSVGENHLWLVQEETSCDLNEEIDSVKEEDRFQGDIKFTVPDGIVTVANDIYSGDIWTHNLESPVVKAWILDNGQLSAIDVFHNAYVPESLPDSFFNTPILYIGWHENQYYIHHSAAIRDRIISGNRVTGRINTPQIEWKPAEEPDQVPFEESQATNKNGVLPNKRRFSHGLYIYDSNPQQCIPDMNQSNLGNEIKLDNETESYMGDLGTTVIIVSLWHWWREILAISLILAVVINIALSLLKRKLKKVAEEVCPVKEYCENISDKTTNSEKVRTGSNTGTGTGTGTTVETVVTSTSSVSRQSSDTPFVSRFLTDFENIRRLGKGGFGIVFEAQNKIDTCHYAIKRIPLPSKLEARQKVMREVKALAKLDHRGIVRFYNSWLEDPPANFDDNNFKEWDDMEVSYATPKSDGGFTTSNAKTSISATQNGLQLTTGGDTFSKGSFSQPTECTNNDDDSYLVFEGSDADENDNKERRSTSDSFSNSKDITQKRRRPSVLVKNQKIYLYIQMQLCQKDTLREWLRHNLDRQMPVLLDFFVQIVNAVEHVHAKGLMHRDLKPSNIFFSLDGCIKIGDFGLVTAATVDDFFHTPDVEKYDHLINSISVVDGKHTDQVGTQLYMSPEQVIGESYSNKVDIFSLGVIFFEMLVPFCTEMERIQTLKKVRQREIPSEFQVKYPEECKFLLKVLSRDPSERPSAEDILQNPLFKTADEEYHNNEIVKRRRTLSSRESDA